jgi:L-ornithine N5-monooxygenase
MTGADDGPLDLIGIGFGPSNLALAIAIEEHNRTAPAPLRARFVERQESFGWHRGMLIDDATMQVSFLKDLVTLRNPTSDYGFLSYLHANDRLVDFVNHKSLFPLRIEFHDYLEWCATRCTAAVDYGHEVTSVRPVCADGVVTAFDVTTGETTLRARNLVLGVGMEARMPDGVRRGGRVWHSGDLLTKVDTLTHPKRLAVIGAGQSAAEVTKYLHDRFPTAEVHAVFSRYGYSPADDSPFANRVFDPAAVDAFYGAPAETKRRILGYHANTNYSVVDLELIEDLYRRSYQEKVLGVSRLEIHNASRLAEVVADEDGVRATVESLTTREKIVLDCDALVCATGYVPVDPLRLLDGVAASCRVDACGRLRVGRDYRVLTSSSVAAGVYLQGGTEHTHGISSSLLSTTATRAGDILGSLLTRR